MIRRVAIEVSLHVFSVYSGWDCTCQKILCYLSELVVLEPSSTSLYLEGRMLDLRTDAGLWSTLNQ